MKNRKNISRRGAEAQRKTIASGEAARVAWKNQIYTAIDGFSKQVHDKHYYIEDEYYKVSLVTKLALIILCVPLRLCASARDFLYSSSNHPWHQVEVRHV